MLRLLRVAVIAAAVYLLGIPLLLIGFAVFLALGLTAGIMAVWFLAGIIAHIAGVEGALAGAAQAGCIGAVAFVALAFLGDALTGAWLRIRERRGGDASFAVRGPLGISLRRRV